MARIGIELRMGILKKAAEQQLLKPLRTHGWNAQITSEEESGEYIVITAVRSDTTRKLALLYTSATSNSIYKNLDNQVDQIFINGSLYKLESFAHGINTPIESISEFFPILVTWNKELSPSINSPLKIIRPQKDRRIISETPIEAIWARIESYSSIYLAEKLVRERANNEDVALTEQEIVSKAAGIAFELQSAIDYFRNVPYESLNKRVLSLYYGTLALASAEMLASPSGATDLEQVEGMTKFGHGLYSIPSVSGEFGEFNIGLLATGFFPQWVNLLGHDTSYYPKAKAKTISDIESLPSKTITTLKELFSTLPEISDLFKDVFESTPSWVEPSYAYQANPNRRDDQIDSSYINIENLAGALTAQRLEELNWPISEITQVSSESNSKLQARVDHPEYKYWHEALPLHKSPLTTSVTITLPVIGGIYEYRAIAMVILYALSILVRYMPSTWRRVEGGDLDQHLALVKAVLSIFERILPQEFLEQIIGERIIVNQSGGLF